MEKFHFNNGDKSHVKYKRPYQIYKHINLNEEQYYLIGFRLENIEKWFLKGAEK